MKFVGLMNSAPVHRSQLTWSNSAAEEKKLKKKRDFRNVDAQMPNPNRHLVIEGDNTSVMHKITDFGTSPPRLGHIFLDIHSSLTGLSWLSVFYS